MDPRLMDSKEGIWYDGNSGEMVQIIEVVEGIGELSEDIV